MCQKGCEVFCVGTAEDALGVAATAKLDATVMDVDIPGIDGLSTWRRLREASQVPVIFLSVYGKTDDRIR